MNSDDRYYNYFLEYWLSIYRWQTLRAKIENNESAMKEIYDNINKNWNLKREYKKYILELIGLKYLESKGE